MPKSAKGLRAYELSGLLFRRRCPCLHLKSPPNSSHAEFGLQTPVKQVILHAGGSNHPKSRKAIVTKNPLRRNHALTRQVPITPKAERRL